MNPPIFVSVSTEPGISSAERETIRYDQFVAKLLKQLPEPLNACHIAMGIAGELGELFEVDANEIEESGDLEFYVQAACNHYGLTFQECWEANPVANVDDHQFVYWVGQFVDCVKREYIYNKPREHERIKECLGTIYMWLWDSYTDMGIPRSEVLQANAIKLEKRYAGLYYSDLAAIERADKKEA